MQLLGHITEEGSRAIATTMILLLIAAITVVAFVIWGVVVAIRSWRQRSDSTRESDEVEK